MIFYEKMKTCDIIANLIGFQKEFYACFLLIFVFLDLDDGTYVI
uniref:Uncharacterized protein n=1 Tax=Meloidogyne enterolobii TaxID=390850 RepID=A0A6V7UFS7_MELEN|nr:unnamed protein product [Meloidogyne enterolobii]